MLLKINSQQSNTTLNKDIKVDIVFDTEGESVNTLSGKIVFDNKSIKIEKILINNSYVNLWIDKPILKNDEDNFIEFSGIIPGGVSVKDANMFSLIIRGISEGDTFIKIDKPEVYLNDGLGNKIDTKTQDLKINFNQQNLDTILEYKDNIEEIPPENFTILRSKDASLFENKWFIVFETQDKGSGINRYEVCENFYINKCVKAISPYQLKNQSNWYFIMVKSHDNQNNVRKEFLISNNILVLYFILICTIIILTIYVLYKKYKKTNN